MTRNLKWFIKGFFWLEPITDVYGDDFRCWERGQLTSMLLMLGSVPVVIFTAGFAIGRLS